MVERPAEQTLGSAKETRLWELLPRFLARALLPPWEEFVDKSLESSDADPAEEKEDRLALKLEFMLPKLRPSRCFCC